MSRYHDHDFLDVSLHCDQIDFMSTLNVQSRPSHIMKYSQQSLIEIKLERAS